MCVARCSGIRIGCAKGDLFGRSSFLRTHLRRCPPKPLRERPVPLRGNPLERVATTFENEKQLESTKLPSEVRLKVESAVESQGHRVTVGDVSGKAGVTLAEAEDALKALAADSLGTLEVSAEGEVIYVFPRDFRNQIRSKSFLLRWEPRLKVMASTAAWMGRVAFGVFFVTSVIVVWTAILAIAMSGDRDDSRSNRGSRSSAVWFNVIDIMRLFSYMNVYRSYDNDIEERRDPNRMNFLESVFSFMFGDGDPNANFDDLRWNTIGNYIRLHRGVVVAEELAPFLDLPEKTDEESFVVDEGFMLPVLTRFEGEPVVNDQGQLVYVFPKFQTTAMSWMPRKQSPMVTHLAEQRWQFSKAKWGQLALVASFAVANVIGVSILDGLIYEKFAMEALTIPGLPYLLMALQIYACSFFTIPIVRWFSNRWKNRTIDARNQRRAKSATSLTLPSASLREKLESAQRLKKRRFVSRKDVVFSSSKEMDEQTKRWEEDDFERRLNEIGQ